MKDGSYDIKKEEVMLIKLIRSLGQRGDVADKIIAQLGIQGLQKKLENEKSKMEGNIDPGIGIINESSLLEGSMNDMFHSIGSSLTSVEPSSL